MAFTVVSITMGWVGYMWVLIWDFAVIMLLVVMICLRMTLSGFYIISICTAPLASLVEAVSRRMLLIWLMTRGNSSICLLHVHLHLPIVKLMATRCVKGRTCLVAHRWWINAAKLGLYWVADFHSLVVIWIVLMEILFFLNFFVFFIARLTLVFSIFFCYRRASPACSTPESSLFYRRGFIGLKLRVILFLWAPFLDWGNSLIHASITVIWLLIGLFLCNTLIWRAIWGLVMALRTLFTLFRE